MQLRAGSLRRENSKVYITVTPDEAADTFKGFDVVLHLDGDGEPVPGMVTSSASTQAEAKLEADARDGVLQAARRFIATHREAVLAEFKSLAIDLRRRRIERFDEFASATGANPDATPGREPAVAPVLGLEEEGEEYGARGGFVFHSG